jgi:hypothetical protein
MAQAKRIFRTGEPIIKSGVYRVVHAIHRVPHEVTLLTGQIFPRCSKCADSVQFELIHAATEMPHEGGFHIVLYELPVEENESPGNTEFPEDKPPI